MTAAIAHRGRDGAGEYYADGVALGHRRRSIIDLAGGTSPCSTRIRPWPLCSTARSIILWSCGENWQRRDTCLPPTLRHRGAAARLRGVGRGDAGPAAGMFAFALWDEKDKSLFCARDHFGIKPFYYYQNGRGEFLFGSEIKSFLPHPGFEKSSTRASWSCISPTSIPRENTF